MSVYNDVVTGLNEVIEYEKNAKYIKQHPYVDDDGMYMPVNEYAINGADSYYRMVMSKEMFVEAYNKWIKGENNNGSDQNK